MALWFIRSSHKRWPTTIVLQCSLPMNTKDIPHTSSMNTVRYGEMCHRLSHVMLYEEWKWAARSRMGRKKCFKDRICTASFIQQILIEFPLCTSIGDKVQRMRVFALLLWSIQFSENKGQYGRLLVGHQTQSSSFWYRETTLPSLLCS